MNTFPPSSSTPPNGVKPMGDSSPRGSDALGTAVAAVTDKSRATSDPVQRVAQSAHESIDRFAAHAAPAVRSMSETRDEWAESLRGTVRGHPLTAVVASVALGALIGRLVR